MGNKKTVYDVVTDRFLAQLKDGIVPWKKPWISVAGERVGGWSHKTGESYSVLNQMMLPAEGEYITYKQLMQEGGQLKEAAQGYPICFWKSFKTTAKDPDTNVEEEKYIPVLRYYTVYRVEDCEGIAYHYKPDSSLLDELTEPERFDNAEATAKTYLDNSGVRLNFSAGYKACYIPLYDEVRMPLRKQFSGSAEYYSTLFHELTHSTGHRGRLNRLGTGTSKSGHSYSLEELVAEIGAAAILYKLGIETQSSIENSNAYLQSWYAALSNDSRMIVKASARAQKAVRYIFGDESVSPCKDWKACKESA